jgi:hypothetical protein
MAARDDGLGVDTTAAPAASTVFPGLQDTLFSPKNVT